MLDKMLKEIFVMVDKKIFHHAEGIDGRVRKEFVPILTPVYYKTVNIGK